MPHIWEAPIQCQNHLLLFLEPRLEPLRICQVQRQQFFITIQLIGHRALSYLHPSPLQLLVDLRDAALLLLAQHPDQRDHIQPEFSMGHRPLPSSSGRVA